MANCSVSKGQPILSNEQRRCLMGVYKLILSWPEPLEIETANLENFGEDTEPAVENAPTRESDANEE